jgi:hypothetical protein
VSFQDPQTTERHYGLHVPGQLSESAYPTGPRASTAAPSVAPVDARGVLGQLATAGMPISAGVVQDENTDPNQLLGRPNGYASRASFDVPGGNAKGEKYDIDRGGVIEVWPDAASAKTRADYIAGLQKGSTLLGSEYHYLNGPVLVRVSGKVKPSVAKQFATAVARLRM